MLPNAGDIIWAVLDPVRGTEQAGRRPVLILSDRIYHERSTRTVACPITSTARDWPFDVALPLGLKTAGVVLVDQVRTLHRSSRLKDFIEVAPDPLLAEVRGRLRSLLGLD